jgi:hypothetical protein
VGVRWFNRRSVGLDGASGARWAGGGGAMRERIGRLEYVVLEREPWSSALRLIRCKTVSSCPLNQPAQVRQRAAWKRRPQQRPLINRIASGYTVGHGPSTPSSPLMDRADVAVALCELATYLREHPDTSLAARRQELLGSGVSRVSAADLAPILRERPQLVESWTSYVEDQRTADGWYVTVRNVPRGESAWIVAGPRNSQSLQFDSRVAAFATLIVRIVGPPRGCGRPRIR